MCSELAICGKLAMCIIILRNRGRLQDIPSRYMQKALDRWAKLHIDYSQYSSNPILGHAKPVLHRSSAPLHGQSAASIVCRRHHLQASFKIFATDHANKCAN